MSQLLINQYLNRLSRLRQITGASRETQVREAFKRLLEDWGESKGLTFVAEYDFVPPTKNVCRVDGVLLESLRAPFGWWEAKDTSDDLDAEIEKKFRKGYPQDNIIFEDGRTAVLWQDRQETMRCAVEDTDQLGRLLGLFFDHEPAPTRDFRRAVERFKTDLPAVLTELRRRIDRAYADNPEFAQAARDFLRHAQETINPALGDADVREMLIQHILTEDIFARVFGDDDFHRENNVAESLYALEAKFFRGEVKKQTLAALEPYYAGIRSTSAQIGSHAEKQRFLKSIYENFYKVYNPKAADRLGVIYTPTEIVRFMVQSADWLCEKHFGKALIDRDVEILDPATGTGTFIVELLEHFRGRPEALEYKYRNELHANEVAILPYYVANLNIEATYAAITGRYTEFPNLCFVDTLDNTAALKTHIGQHYGDLIGGISGENIERINRQNERKISVIIGNPPYNANQQNESENNKNREYSEIDSRIRATYIRESTAQKTKLYDMYSRFFRWASDRIEEDGIVAFITNRGFLDKRNFDGFRKVVEREFNEVYVVDLGGDVRENPRLSGTKHNVFGIQTGVAISFLVKRRGAHGCRIHYGDRPEFDTAKDKLSHLQTVDLERATPEVVRPDASHNWLKVADNDFADFLPAASKMAKAARGTAQVRAIFRSFSLGVVTNRDDWVYARTSAEVASRVEHLIAAYEFARTQTEAEASSDSASGTPFKWTRAVKADLAANRQYTFDPSRIVSALYRPFDKRKLYFSPSLNEMRYLTPSYFGDRAELRNICIAFTDPSSQKPFSVIGIDTLPDLHLVGAAAGTELLPRFRYVDGQRLDNITDWALGQFQERYGNDVITKDDIFAYVYGVLHDPTYRETYAVNLKRELPRIPFYAGFKRWRDWGQELLDLHVGYETAPPFGLARTDLPDARARAASVSSRVILKADHDSGNVVLDSETQLSGVPTAAWDYKLGNRSAIDWVLDQHKEKTPKDPTVRERFNTYRFADHKEHAIDLLQRVTTVSVRTQEIVEAMRSVRRD